MITEQRNALLPILERVERLMGGTPESGRRATDAPPSFPGQTHVDREELVRIRGDLRKQLFALREELGQMLTERDCYLALFPIVLCLDEIIQTRYANVDELSWPLLQREFFGVDRGGELFYDTLEELLGGALASQLALELFYFCLSVGFKGKLAGQEDRIAAYLQRLRNKVEVALPSGEDTDPGLSARIKPTGRYWWYYAVAVALLVALYVLLRSLAAEEPRSAGVLSAPGRAAAARIVDAAQAAEHTAERS